MTESIKEAKAICSQATLDAQALCFTTVKEVKATCIVAVKEAKMTQAHSIQEAKAACSTTIRDAEAWRPPGLSHSKGSMATSCRTWEMQAIQEESRGQADFLSTCQAALYTSPVELKSTFYWGRHLYLTHLSHCKGLPQ